MKPEKIMAQYLRRVHRMNVVKHYKQMCDQIYVVEGDIGLGLEALLYNRRYELRFIVTKEEVFLNSSFHWRKFKKSLSKGTIGRFEPIFSVPASD